MADVTSPPDGAAALGLEQLFPICFYQLVVVVGKTCQVLEAGLLFAAVERSESPAWELVPWMSLILMALDLDVVAFAEEALEGAMNLIRCCH